LPGSTRLVGAVAEGWATEHSDIRIELCADDSKAVELALLNAGVDYRTMPTRARTTHTSSASTRLGAACACPRTRRSDACATSAHRGRERRRLDAEAVEALIKGQSRNSSAARSPTRAAHFRILRL
jgi:hypothetical protein